MKIRSSLPFVFAGIATAALLLFAFEQYRSYAAPVQPMLPVLFEHADHSETACAECHHNFTDGTGGGPCYVCHKHTPEIAPAMEKMFHDFCFDCHAITLAEGEEAGPPRQCAGCHGAQEEAVFSAHKNDT